MDMHKTHTRWLGDNWSTFGVRTSQGQHKHKTHHGPDLREATTFPLIIYYVAGHGTHIQMAFFLGTPSGSLEIAQVGTPAILEPHNFARRPLIEMWFEAKL
jgi:hypothetical protein